MQENDREEVRKEVVQTVGVTVTVLFAGFLFVYFLISLF